ncbi:glycosyltransferase family 2 protein [Marivita sp. GX14005]|uniref:glycosyltransferase family 2 protein n=1 Tax=Marivita sp. GX14005 TaxID=2942276 RepID=UPI00201890DE|nr:glycosyltransferase family 2 protein [Marivita sp. GX14005]MCL3881729.1 glycosyltransferase [Marivita sp. GX14005]
MVEQRAQIEERPPKVSVVIPAFNAENTLERAVLSALNQTASVEIVIVDDASSDGTAALAETLCAQSPSAKLLRQPVNAGPAAARNRAIDESGAPWIALLDADDFMASDRIALLLARAESGEFDFLADDIYRVTEEDLLATNRRLWSDDDFGFMDVTFLEFVTGNLHGNRGQRGELGFIKPLIRRAFLETHGLRYCEELRLAEDYVFYSEALLAGAKFGLSDPYGYFAVHRARSISGQHGTRDLGALVRADRRLMRKPGLTPADTRALRTHCRRTHREWAWRRLIDAVRMRDLRQIAAFWKEPPHVLMSLAGKLAAEARLRSLRMIDRRLGSR